MRGELFTGCKLHLSHGPLVPEDAFLVTSGGSAYRVDRVAGRTLHCTRWPLEEVPDDALIIEWRWSVRRRG